MAYSGKHLKNFLSLGNLCLIVGVTDHQVYTVGHSILKFNSFFSLSYHSGPNGHIFSFHSRRESQRSRDIRGQQR